MGVHGSTIDDVPWDEGPPHTPVLIIAHVQWPFQDPRLEVPTIYKAYFLGLCKGISPQNMALYGTVPPF